jgi:hypothetical protein
VLYAFIINACYFLAVQHSTSPPVHGQAENLVAQPCNTPGLQSKQYAHHPLALQMRQNRNVARNCSQLFCLGYGNGQLLTFDDLLLEIKPGNTSEVLQTGLLQFLSQKLMQGW